jgi:dTDP-4-dehydrorhamnose 3,5-epimerase-like enzyme
VSTGTCPEVGPLDALFTDDRGRSALLLQQSTAVDFLEYLEFAHPGAVRGGHFHRRYTEHLFVADGRLEAELIDCRGRVPTDLRRMELGAGMVLRIPGGWGHRFTAREPSRAIAWGYGGSPVSDRADVGAEHWSQ